MTFVFQFQLSMTLKRQATLTKAYAYVIDNHAIPCITHGEIAQR